MDSAPQSSKRRKDQRPLEILRAAIAEFTEQGFAHATISAIAKRAGAAKGTVYLYFDTKEALFEEAVRQFIKPLFAGIRAQADQFEGSSRDLLELLIKRVYKELVETEERRLIIRIVIGEGHRFPQIGEFYYHEIIHHAQKMLKKILDRGIASGEFRDLPAKNFPAVVMGPVMMAAVWKMTFDTAQPLDVDRFCEAHLDLILNGLCTRH